jgi:hypothetical protein
MAADNTNLVTVPEFAIYEMLTRILQYIRDNYTDIVTTQGLNESKTFLYQLCRSTGFLRLKYYNAAKKVFLAEIDDPRFLEVELIYNMQRMGPPTIYISHPGEQSGDNGLGLDQNVGGVIQYNTDGDLYDPEDETQEEVDYRETYTRRYNATYQLVITSDNPDEVIMLYHILKALITTLQASNHLQIMGLEAITLGGNDITLRAAPDSTNKMFAKAIIMNLQYDTKTIAMDTDTNPLGLLVHGIMTQIELDN